MSVTTIDPATALIVVDLQKGGLSVPPVPNRMADVISRSRALADAFRARGLPVILVKVVAGAPGRAEHVRSGPRPPRPADWTDFVPELDQQPGDHVVEKRTWGAFTGTGLADYLDANDVTQVVVTGCATSIGVESTARQAHELGLNVTIVIDAVTDVDGDAHWNSVKRIFPRMSETGTAQEVLEILSAAA
jgi:nicotinamidase-related amidase